MKIRLLILTLFFLTTTGLAQQRLNKSRQSSPFTYIYQLTDKEMASIAYVSKWIINDSFFHTVVDSFATEKGYLKKLVKGNYLFVRAEKNKLIYTLHAEKNVDLQFVNDQHNFQFYIKDFKGNLIENAEVSLNRRKSPVFDPKTKLYHTSFQKTDQVIAVKYNGMLNYFDFEVAERYRRQQSFWRQIIYSAPIKYTWQPIKRLMSKRRYSVKNNYQGYLVFSKPMYKPLDTVKFKAYILTGKGKNITNVTADVMLYADNDKPIKLATLKAYNNGGYTYQFVLADSLGLTLDDNYKLELVAQNKKKDVLISSTFRYEDYELKSLDFTVRTNKTEHLIGAPVTVFMKATDENELPVADGKVEIVALTQDVGKYYGKKVFIPDTLFKKNLNLDPVGETKFILPDTIFPKASLNFSLNFSFSNSNNETREQSRTITYTYKGEETLQEIKAELQKDSVHFDYRENNQPVAQTATIKAFSVNEELLDSVVVNLPVSLKADYRVDSYEVTLKNGYHDDVFMGDFKPELSINAMQTKDSLRVSITNENKIPFWYTIFSGNQVLTKGYALRLDTTIHHSSSKAAFISLSYFWDDEEKRQEASAAYDASFLNVKLIAPNTVYPGQQVKMLVNVTDINEKPVTETDLTAYSYTSKFEKDRMPSLPRFSKRYKIRKRQERVSAEKIDGLQGDIRLNWLKWSKTIGLDSIEYYKFTHPVGTYTFNEKITDTLAQIAPFVIDDGTIEPVSIVYIDEIPVYFSQADQLQRYAFRVAPGTHQIRLRTAKKMVQVQDFELKSGFKTVLSISAELINPLAKVSLQKAELSSSEAQELEQYMIRITDNFEDEETLLKTDNSVLLLNPTYSFGKSRELLIGPVKENVLGLVRKDFSHSFLKEPGYTYTFFEKLIKQKSFSNAYAFRTDLRADAQNENDNYKQYALKKGEIDSIWNEGLNLRSASTKLFSIEDPSSSAIGEFEFSIDTAFTKSLPYFKNIIVYKTDQADFILVYPGNTRHLEPLEAGSYRILFLLKDNRYFTATDVQIKAYGKNYYEWKSFQISRADKFSIDLDQYIKSAKSFTKTKVDTKIVETISEKYFDDKSLTNTMTGTIVSKLDGLPIPGATIRVKGLKVGVSTDVNGRFKIRVPNSGKIVILYLGYVTLEKSIKNGDAGKILLVEDMHLLQEVVVSVVGVESQRFTASLSGKVAGVAVTPGYGNKLMIRGINTLTANSNALVMVDGIMMSKDFLSSLNPADIDDVSVLNGAGATALYGSQAANGVIIITTKRGSVRADTISFIAPQMQTLRTKFSDEGFWQPKLITDADGNASFTAKFPDDITNWKTRVIALNGKKQSGYTEMAIKSFKSLSANFVSPLFATEGDSINVIGKLMNYTAKEAIATRKFIFNGKELRNGQVTFKNAHIDTISIAVSTKDSLKFEYTMQQSTGYFDGEIRKIPVVEAGIKETKGYFSALLRDTTINYSFDKSLGKITVRAESSVFPALLDEMTKLRNYEYLCNEQLASKLKSLLLEKKTRSYLNQEFTHEKDINNILKKLLQNKKPQETWGWWNQSEEEIWISLHVVEALLQAEKQGYKIELDKRKLYNYLVNKLAGNEDYSQIQTIRLIHLLDEKYYIKDWVTSLEKMKLKVKPNLFEKLELLELKQMAGIKINLDSILTLKKQTLFGNSYWGDQGNRFWDNSIQNTILAYRILKAEGKHEAELEKIRLYFLEQRKDGQWRNTFESSLILETVLPDLLNNQQKATPVSLVLNQETITKFPYDQTFTDASNLKLTKQGNMPVYFTAYQQFQNVKPAKWDKDFVVGTTFLQKGIVVKKLKAGTLTTLKVEVDVKADADYVMIEIPIPAGCSYENKVQNFWGIETHREYFKEKTSIFCTKLKQGHYTFEIDLMPRYNGNYVLNPAKAEMMYFPVFFGREGMKRIGIN